MEKTDIRYKVFLLRAKTKKGTQNLPDFTLTDALKKHREAKFSPSSQPASLSGAFF